MVNFVSPSNPFSKHATGASLLVNARYRGLASRLLAEASQATSGQAIGVTSSSSGEGVTNTIANLAVTASASAENPILLIDAAANDHGLERLLGLESAAGAAEVLTGREPLARCVQATGTRNLAFLSRGEASPRYETRAWESLVDEAKCVFKLVLLDLPPVAEFASQMTDFGNLDGVLLVVESERARQRSVVRAKAELDRMNIETLGVILNKRRDYVPSWLYDKV
jgi:Mrp family chromosome partitioning ATPase